MDANWNVRSLVWNPTSLDSGKAYINIPSQAPTTLTVQTAVTNTSGGAVQIFPDIVLGGAVTWSDTNTVDSAQPDGSGTTLSGIISGAGSIRKTGSGTLRLISTSNTFDGGLIIEDGTLEVRDTGSLGHATNLVRLDGGTLRIASFPLREKTVELTQPITLGSAGGTIQTRYGSTSFTQPIGGAGELRLEPDASWGAFLPSRYTLSGTNTYAGGTVLGAVSVNLAGSGTPIGTGPVLLKEGAVLALGSASQLVAMQKIALQHGSVLVLADPAINPASVIDSDPARTTGGTLAYATNVSVPLNMATIGNGKLFLGSSGNVTYSASSLGAGSDGVYRVGGVSGENSSLVPVATLTFSGAANVFTGNRSLVIGGSAPAAGGQYRQETVVTLAQPNNYRGGTTLHSGTLVVGATGALGSGALTVVGNAVIAASGGPRQIANALVVDQPEFAFLWFGGAESMTFSGPVNLGGTARTFIGNGPPKVTFAGPISNGGLTLANQSWAFGSANSFAGGLIVSDGAVLDVSNDNQLGAASGSVSLEGGGVLRLTASFTSARPISIGRTGGSVSIDGATLTLTGALSGGRLTKSGTGTLVIAGDNQSSVSALTVGQGTVRVDSSGAAPQGEVTVNSGATLRGVAAFLSGDISAGGRLSPGLEAPGILRFTEGLVLRGGSIVDFDLGLTLFDKIILGTGQHTLSKQGTGTIAVNIVDAGGLAAGQTFTLIDWTGASGTSSITAADFALGSSPVAGTFSIVGKSLLFTAVPEPGAATFLAFGGGWILGRRRSNAARRGKRQDPFRPVSGAIWGNSTRS